MGIYLPGYNLRPVVVRQSEQVPPGHPPSEALFDPTENDPSFRVVSAEPQLGQFTSASDGASFSNLLPQSSQLYS